ncbi:hypothetical protein [Sunxiuqinia sp. sy24]|uniref:hypothetical protein n=1 Tax=Sunxiuqinia sp. sy24 TaxID=3461495 RepID=UPI004045EE11
MAELLKLKVELLTTDDNDYFFIDTTNIKLNQKNKVLRKECYPCSSHETIIVYPNIGIERYLNSKHKIIKYIIENEMHIERNSQHKDLWESFIELLREFIFYYRIHGEYSKYKFVETMSRLNAILIKINETLETEFEIKNTDFPKWMLEIKEKETRKLTIKCSASAQHSG